MFSVIPMLSLHKPIYCQELWHRVSMFSVIPMPFRHRYLKQLAYSMFLVSKRKVLAPYSKPFSPIISYFHELWHRVSMFSVIPMPFPHKLTLSEDFFFADDPGNSSCDHLRDPECMPDTCCTKNPAQYKCKWKDCHNVTNQGNDQRLYSLSKPF